ncbi:ATP-grasp domain-containing protein [Agromyces humatus]|uniref:ATP-grasp domain-containing protein n=1 Tax=Agromyces humatus TaxID=279573 RepID=UPI001E60BD72|nr:hypothetical protein [Agromyces humatus]
MAGSPTEGPVELLVNAAAELDLDMLVLEEERAADWQLEVESADGVIRAHVMHEGRPMDLSAATGLYLRLTSPEVVGAPTDPLRDARHVSAVGLLASWADIAPLRVANRPTPMSSNGSKPYQAAVIRAAGFNVPETIVTSDPSEVLAFRRRHGRIVYKSISGIRSIVHELTGPRTDDLERVRALPTQFQRLLTGVNVRVHVVGRDVHACEVDSRTIDYRYSEGERGAEMVPADLPDAVRERCIMLAHHLDLPLAGIDLLRDEDDLWWCFEVNPSPAYNCFEEPTGLPIARSLATWLAGRDAA